MDKYDLVLATKDWHPANHVSFASSHPGHSVGEMIELDQGGNQSLWPDHCVQGTPGAEFPAKLKKDKIKEVFFKGINPRIDSYSGLYDNDMGRSTGLEDYLKKAKVQEVHIVGLATEYTVKFTALDCAKAGFKTTVLLAGCKGLNVKEGDAERAIRELKAAKVTVK